MVVFNNQKKWKYRPLTQKLVIFRESIDVLMAEMVYNQYTLFAYHCKGSYYSIGMTEFCPASFRQQHADKVTTEGGTDLQKVKGQISIMLIYYFIDKLGYCL